MAISSSYTKNKAAAIIANAAAAAWAPRFQQRYNYRQPSSGSATQTRTKTSTRGRKRPMTMTQVIRNNTTANHLAIGDGVNFVDLLHNTITTQNLTHFITPGTAQFNRQGDTVYLEALKMNCFWEGPDVSENGVQLRLIVLYHDDFHACDYISDSGLGLTDLAMIGTGGARTTTLITDPKRCTVIDDRTFLMNQALDSTKETTLINYTVQLKKRFDFVPATQEGKDRNLYLVAISSIAGGATGTTLTGKLYVNQDLIFKVSK